MTDDARNRPVLESPVLESPYRTVLKPYGHALVELARQRPEIVCLSGDLTRQCEIDLFQAAFPDRFIHAGMAEANMIGVAGALARSGLIPFVHTFGVFATRRPFDQIVNAVAYPHLPVRIIGFMPGVSSPGGPGGRHRDRPGGGGHRQPAGPGLPAPQARRDPGDLPRRSPAVPR